MVSCQQWVEQGSRKAQPVFGQTHECFLSLQAVWTHRPQSRYTFTSTVNWLWDPKTIISITCSLFHQTSFRQKHLRFHLPRSSFQISGAWEARAAWGTCSERGHLRAPTLCWPLRPTKGPQDPHLHVHLSPLTTQHCTINPKICCIWWTVNTRLV